MSASRKQRPQMESDEMAEIVYNQEVTYYWKSTTE